MPFNTPLAKTEDYIFGRGIGYFAPFDANGVPTGERDLGNLPAVTITAASTLYKHTSSRSGLAVTDLSVTISSEFSAKLDFEDFSAENLALFVGGTTQTVSQAATPITGEVIPNVQGGREYQLGSTAGNPSGVRGVSAVTLTTTQVAGASARANSTPYAIGAIYTSGGNAFAVKTAGTTAASVPSLVTTAPGATTTDGTAVVVYLGPSTAPVVATEYVVSAQAARIAIVDGAAFALASAAYFAVTGNYLSVTVGYTPIATTRKQVTAGSSGSVQGSFRFIADNAEGENRDFFIPSCTLSASGDLPLISDNAVGKASFDLGINQKDSSTAQVYIDSRPIF